MSCHGRSTPTSLDPSIVVIVFMLTFFLEIYLRFLDFCESLLLARRECKQGCGCWETSRDITWCRPGRPSATRLADCFPCGNAWCQNNPLATPDPHTSCSWYHSFVSVLSALALLLTPTLSLSISLKIVNNGSASNGNDANDDVVSRCLQLLYGVAVVGA